ncbi:membrane protein containing Extracellular ligand-binding receptor domain protein [Candidatus Magnetomorum sp. HK-1]|nr:membrane protein containing Extracellular ligand-binding receptor domain protein [Candidatus Magnetomorum sp. HK-1]
MKKLSKKSIFFSLSFIILCTIVLYTMPSQKDKKTVYVGVIGPMSGKGRAYGKAMLKGINLCLEEFKNSGGMENFNVKLIVLDDKNDQRLAPELAQKMADEGKSLMVLGHYFSSVSYAAGRIYKKKKLPAITASATSDNVTLENDWYFRIIPTNSFQGSFIANYVNKTLRKESASIIYDQDSYGVTLMQSFEESAGRLGMDIKKKWSFDHSSPTIDDDLEQITRELRAMDDPGMIFVATHSGEGVKIITSLKYPGTSYTIIGPDAFGGEAFIKYLRDYPQEKLIPGYYSDGIYTISPFIIDIANEKAQVFRHHYVQKYNEEPSWVTAGYYDTMSIALHAIKNAGISGDKKNIQKDRYIVRDFLSGMTTPENGYEGVNGNIHFNVDGDYDKPLAVGVYKNQRLISTLTQYQLITDLNTVDNMLKEILEGNIILIDGKFMNKTKLVYTGIDINSIGDLNLSKSSCVIDYYLWFRFEDEFDDSNLEFVNSVNPLKLGSPIIEEKIGNLTTRAYRMKAPFKVDFKFHEYPFDTQTLKVQFRHVKQTRDKLIYITDILGMRLKSSSSKKSKFSALSSWKTESVMFFQNIITNNSTLGVPKFFNSKNSIKYSQFNAQIKIKRRIVSFLIKNLILIFVMIIISYVTYYIPPDSFPIRISIGMSTLLTTAFSHIKLSQQIPVGYILAIEHAFFSVYGLATLSILASVLIFKQWKRTEGEGIPEEVQRDAWKKIWLISLAGRLVHPLIVLLISFILTHIYVLEKTNIGSVLLIIFTGLIGILGLVYLFALKFRNKKINAELVSSDSERMPDQKKGKIEIESGN